MRFSDAGKISVSISTGDEALIDNPMIAQGLLNGRLKLQIPSKKSLNGLSYSCRLQFRRTENKIYGVIEADVEGKRPSFILPFYAAFEKLAKQ